MILIIGHARHGKDTVAEILKEDYGYNFVSSSWFVLEKAIWPEWGQRFYSSKEECFKDRTTRRGEWFNLIKQYTFHNPQRLVEEMKEEGLDIYVGMRRREEFEKSKHHFDKILWVDRTEHLSEELPDSMQLTREDADYVVDNNGTLSQLHQNVNECVENYL